MHCVLNTGTSTWDSQLQRCLTSVMSQYTHCATNCRIILTSIGKQTANRGPAIPRLTSRGRLSRNPGDHGEFVFVFADRLAADLKQARFFRRNAVGLSHCQGPM